jgi:hypothetical protein
VGNLVKKYIFDNFIFGIAFMMASSLSMTAAIVFERAATLSTVALVLVAVFCLGLFEKNLRKVLQISRLKFRFF